jgi:TRAP-type uncharacterized transport system substrate-binding protein
MFMALQDGQLDIAMFPAYGGLEGPVIIPPFVEQLLVMTGGELYLVGWPHDALSQAIARVGYDRPLVTIPAGTLPTQTGPVEAIGLVTPALMCHEDADDDLIYEITKTLAENTHLFGDYYPGLAGITPENMVKLLPLNSEEEVHPGAIKYYEEAGLWPKYWDERYWVGPPIS